jgi:hypothetical protein
MVSSTAIATAPEAASAMGNKCVIKNKRLLSVEK